MRSRTEAPPSVEGALARAATADFGHRLRIVLVLVLSEWKLKYAGSVLGYVWSIIKPLALFTILYLVFGRIFNLDAISPYYSVALLIGIVLFSFVGDATTQGMIALVHRESLLRRMRFPRIVIPVAATLTAGMTFCVNLLVVAGFVAWEDVVPQLDWLLLLPLLLELYVFTLGMALILTTLYVPLRDMGQVWELALQLLFYASPIIYPISYLSPWLRDIAFVFPFTQVLQDVRAIVLHEDSSGITITADDALGDFARLLPIGITLIVFAAGVALFKRYEPWFAERV